MRTKAGLLQKEAAHKLGIAQNTLSQYENEARRVKVELLPKMSELYGCTIEELYGEKGLETGTRKKPAQSGAAAADRADL